jgi:hypothetical protein
MLDSIDLLRAIFTNRTFLKVFQICYSILTDVLVFKILPVTLGSVGLTLNSVKSHPIFSIQTYCRVFTPVTVVQQVTTSTALHLGIPRNNTLIIYC